MQIRGFIFPIICSFQIDSTPLKYIQQALFFFYPSQQLNHTSTSDVCNVICYVGISLPSLERLSHKILAIRMRIFLMAGKPILRMRQRQFPPVDGADILQFCSN